MHAPNPLAKTLGSWLLLMFALVMSSTAWAQRDDGQYQILQAVYGTDQRSIDVTDRLKQLAARDQRFKLTNDLFNNVDPAPGQRKMLRIHARGPDGQPRTFDYIEYSWVDGAQFLGWSTGRWGQRGDNMGRQAVESVNANRGNQEILQATYGAHTSRVDVTQTIRQLVRRNKRFQLTNELFNTDPAPGARKSLTVEFTLGNGPVLQTTAQEGQWLRLP